LALDPGLRADFGRKSKLFAEANFTVDVMTQRVRDLYAELLEAKRARRVQVSRVQANDAPVRPLRVAIIAASSRYVGGQSVQAEWLLEAWSRDPEVEASSISIDPPFPAMLKWVESIPVLRAIIRQPFYLWALWRGLRKADLAHIFSASYWSFFVAPAPALMMARLMGKCTLIHYHSGEARDHLQRSPAARWVLRKAQGLIVPSDFLVGVFREFGLEASAVPNIVDTSQFRFRPRSPLRPHLLCTRGFHPYYRVDIVVHAFAEVKALYPDAQLDLVGSGPLESEIRALVGQLNLRGVTFAGVASRAEIPKFYDQADIFVNASDLDNMPVSILEAFASGLPVVSTEPEGMRYVVEQGKTGLLSPPGDSHQLAENVVTLLGEPALAAQIIANARSRCEGYQWKVVREQWLQLYRSLRAPAAAAEKVTSVA
jgi:glycosyltransferase involved in cell wall biosynthesis